MLMLDLCTGLGGASRAMRDRGWTVITLDSDPAFRPTIIANLATWHYAGPQPDLIWASPPCTEFSRESMPWSRTGQQPDLSLVQAAQRVICEAGPRYWVVENVRGAVRWLGTPREIHGPFYLWGNFPPLGRPCRRLKPKERYSGAQRAERALVPYALSLALAIAVEAQQAFDWQAAA